ncbi:MAG: hypothetical protein NC350_04700 [Corallococcus sp.]|nr:hypothetical protein [Corallococcus sp.]
MKKLTYSQKYWISEIGAYFASLGIPIVTACIMFPEQIMEETKMSVGLALILTVIVSLTVFRKKIAEMFDNSTAVSAWAIILCASLIAKYFVDQMFVISIVGLAANLGATPLFKYADKQKQLNLKLKELKDNKKLEEQVNENTK